MKVYKGNSVPDDLYYLILSYCDKTDWKWFINNGLVTKSYPGIKTITTLTKDQLNDLINSAIEYNMSMIKYSNQESA